MAIPRTDIPSPSTLGELNNLTANAPAETCGKMSNSGYRVSLAEQAEKNTQYHYEQAEKASRAAHFLRQHPEFDEFVQLIRMGALQI